MVSGILLEKTLTKEMFIQLYEKNGSIEGVHKETGFDTNALRKFMKRNNIPFKYKTKYNHNDNAFAINTKDSNYWAGFIAADGCIKTKKNTKTKIIAIGLANKDKDHLIKFKTFLKADEPIKEYKKYSSIHIVSQKIASDLLNFNIVPKKSLIYKFPKIKQKYLKDFMRGYFDGDGGISINKKKQIVISIRGTKKYLEKYKYYLVKNCNVNNVKISFSNNFYILCYCGNINATKILTFLYKNSSTYLNRKYNLFINQIGDAEELPKGLATETEKVCQTGLSFSKCKVDTINVPTDVGPDGIEI